MAIAIPPETTIEIAIESAIKITTEIEIVTITATTTGIGPKRKITRHLTGIRGGNGR